MNAAQIKQVHDLASLIPVRADPFEVSIQVAQEGLRERVILYEGKIIEGRVRYSACLELGIAPQFRNWVLLDVPEKDPVDWMVRRHVETHQPDELDLIRLVANLLPYYREQTGSTHGRLNRVTGLSARKVRVTDWLQEIGALDKVLSGEKDLIQVARETGLVAEKRGVALGQRYGAGDKFDEATQPIVRYLKAWKRKGYEYRHVNPKEATRRVLLLESIVEEANAALVDLRRRAKTATLSAPPERRTTK